MKLSENVRGMSKTPKKVTSQYLKDVAASIATMETFDTFEELDDFATLRDQFAIAALQGISSSINEDRIEDIFNRIQAGGIEASVAYSLADAMMKARE